jgi:hypothetical protein
MILTITFTYFILVLTAFGHNMKDSKDVFALCSYEDMKCEILCCLLEAFSSTFAIIKSKTRNEHKEIWKSYVNIFQIDLQNFLRIIWYHPSRYVLLSWATKHVEKSMVYSFLVFNFFKILFEYHNEQGLYDAIVKHGLT